MASFLFQAKTIDGRMIKGEVEANDETEARLKIRSKQLVPLKVVSRQAQGQKAKAKPIGFFEKKVNAKELQVFTRQFAVLVGAGVPIVQSLESMATGGRSPLLLKTLRQVTADVEKGRRLGESLKLHPLVFDRMYINLVQAGEEGGVLDTVLNRLAIYIEKSVKLRSKITKAMWYPGIVIVVAFGVVTGILVFVIPSFVSMFQQTGRELPWLTQAVIKLSAWVAKYWYILVGSFVSAPFIIRSYYQTSEGRKTIDKMLIEIPIFGDLIQKSAIARFSRTLSTLLAAGVRIIDSLEIAAATSGNYVIEGTLMRAKDSIAQGKTVSEQLRKSKHIPEMVSSMISVGEQTGAMDAMLSKIADFYEDEVESTADAMTALVEPVLMVVLGGIIAVLVIAMYLPIFEMAGGV